MGDRVATIILLVIGAFGALTSAQSMLGMGASFALIADALGISDFTAPSWLGTLGTVSAIAFIAVYAVTLIYSIQRMRAGRITFWVPLVAGVVVVVATIIITTIALMSSPEIVSEMSKPDATQRMLDYLTTMDPSQ